MTTLPSGAVTLMFTDIEGSTGILMRLGDAYPGVLFAHRDLIQTAIVAHGGRLLETQGDSMYAVFPRALAGVRAAARAQAALAAYPWPDQGVVRVRMGLHTGEPVRTGGSYVGLDVHRAARISAAGHGGQVLLSAETAELVQRRLRDGLALWDMGVHTLRGIAHPEHLYQLVQPGLPATFPPLKTPDAPPTSLPEPPDRLVGREREMAGLTASLLDPTGRMITVTGPGGSGKSRLAIEAAAAVAPHFPHGVTFVPIAPLTGPRELLPALARTLAVRETDARPQRERLAAFLRDQRRLLVLDGCDGQAAAFPDLVALLDGAPRLNLLITSRVPLGLDGEQVVKLAGLEVGGSGQTSPPLASAAAPSPTAVSVSRLSNRRGSPGSGLAGDWVGTDADEERGKPESVYPVPPPLRVGEGSRGGEVPPSVELFLERAVAARPDFEVTAEQLREVMRICALVDGRPLSIELTAARIKTLPPRAVYSRLERRLAFLTSSGDARAARPALRGAIAWSYHLLSPSEQTLFRRLAAFAGGWTVAAARAVCDAGDLDGGVPAGLASLREKRLIVFVHGGARRSSWVAGDGRQWAHLPDTEETRFEMPDTIRDYALERLIASREEGDTRVRHAGWFLTLAEAAEPALAGPEREQWLARLDRDRNNLNAALRWSSSALVGVGTMARLAAALTPYWRLRGALSAGRRWLDLALPRTAGADATRARALQGAGVLASAQGDADAARARFAESVALWRLVDDRLGLARSLTALGSLGAATGAVEAAEPLEEAHQLARELDEPGLVAEAAYQLGMLALVLDDPAAARPRFEESLAQYRAAGDLWDVALPLGALGVLSLVEGEFAIARRHLEDALALLETAGDAVARCDLLGHLTRVYWVEGDMPHVLERGRVWLERARAEGDRQAEARALLILGIAARSRNDDERALALLAESLAINLELDNRTGLAGCLVGFARIARVQGQGDVAARLFGAAAAVFGQIRPGTLADRLDLSRIDAALRTVSGAIPAGLDEALALIATMDADG